MDLVRLMVVSAMRQTDDNIFELNVIVETETRTIKNSETKEIVLKDDEVKGFEIEIVFNYFDDATPFNIKVDATNDYISLEDLQKVKMFLDECIKIYKN